MYYDASFVGISSIICQSICGYGKDYPITFDSKQFNMVEKNYTIIEK